MADFDPRFEIMPGTKPPLAAGELQASPYQAVPCRTIAE
jgi:hypothetical protein